MVDAILDEMAASCGSDLADEADDSETDAFDLASSAAVQHSMSLSARQGQAAAGGGGCILPLKPPI